MQTGFDAPYAYDTTTLSRSSSEPTLSGDNESSTSLKRKKPPLPSGTKPVKKVKRVGPKTEDTSELMSTADGDKDGDGAGKAKRVRTGCLTCRERHLKCDEGLPNCNNCKKSNRVCKRGVRLNFIDTWTERPPVILSFYGSHKWRVEFQDESREIASEYRGGTQKYQHLKPENDAVPTDPSLAFDYTQATGPTTTLANHSLPPIHGIMASSYPDPTQADMGVLFENPNKQDPYDYPAPPAPQQQPPNPQYTGSSQSSIHPGSVGSYNTGHLDMNNTRSGEGKEFVDSAEETLFMQVFVEEVGLWMDSMDAQKHFSRLLPFHSLSEPMLLNAFLACGARHLTLVNPAYTEEKALHYYDTATTFLLQSLQNPNRDTVVCATTAVILNVYEIMSERALQRMNHIAGARALIKECGWNAHAQGIGQACFWLNVGLEVLSCLHFNWQVAWDPDTWGIDMSLSRETLNGNEETWTHRMLYIVAKICNFRATMPRFREPDSRDQQHRTQQRFERWSSLKSLCDAWNDGIPRTMHPMAFLYPQQTTSKSAFPEVWLIKRTTIVARLFYHTALLLLAQTNPFYSAESNSEMSELQTRHSQMICGIAAHVKDRGVASVAIRSLAHAAEVLTKRNEQEEVLEIFNKINKETGWRIGYIYQELMEKWGWQEQVSPEMFAQTHTAAKQQKLAQDAHLRSLQLQAQHTQSLQQQDFAQRRSSGAPNNSSQQPASSSSASSSSLPPPPPPPPQTLQPSPAPSGPPSGGAGKKMPQGIPNPMYKTADFNLPQHPYQNFYVAPNHVNAEWNLGSSLGHGVYYHV